jgi:hypothetical protein
MRPFTGFPDEQKCGLYNIDARFLSGQDWALKSRVGRPSEVTRSRHAGTTVVAAPEIEVPGYENPNRGSSGVKLWKVKNRGR